MAVNYDEMTDDEFLKEHERPWGYGCVEYVVASHITENGHIVPNPHAERLIRILNEREAKERVARCTLAGELRRVFGDAFRRADQDPEAAEVVAAIRTLYRSMGVPEPQGEEEWCGLPLWSAKLPWSVVEECRKKLEELESAGPVGKSG